MPSTALVGESLLFEAARVLNGTNALSYYQYKSLESLLEVMIFHESASVLIGEETDEEFLESFDWLISEIHEATDFKIDLIKKEDRANWITQTVMQRFDEICRELYHHSIGITSADLFSKQRKDRTSEDMSEYIEQMFVRSYPNFVAERFAEDIYELWVKNANSSELLYFLRAHLFQALSEIQLLTPIYENQRLISGVLQRSKRAMNRIGTLPYEIYKMANALFIKTCHELLPSIRVDYPRLSIGMLAMLDDMQDRKDFLSTACQLRSQLKDFREFYSKAEEILTDGNKSVADKSVIYFELEQSVNLVWAPLISTLGRRYSSSNIVKIAKGVFGKYGVGDIKLEHSANVGPKENESSASYSTSLIGVATALGTSVADAWKDAKLLKPNKTLIDIVLRSTQIEDTKQKISTILPIRDFTYKTPQLIDSWIYQS